MLITWNKLKNNVSFSNEFSIRCCPHINHFFSWQFSLLTEQLKTVQVVEGNDFCEISSATTILIQIIIIYREESLSSKSEICVLPSLCGSPLFNLSCTESVVNVDWKEHLLCVQLFGKYWKLNWKNEKNMMFERELLSVARCIGNKRYKYPGLHHRIIDTIVCCHACSQLTMPFNVLIFKEQMWLLDCPLNVAALPLVVLFYKDLYCKSYPFTDNYNGDPSSIRFLSCKYIITNHGER